VIERFSGLAACYDRYRPAYPPEAIAAIFAGLTVSHRLSVVDVGAGTGIGTRQLLAHKAAVVGIEPNADMRAVARSFASDVRPGEAARTGLPAGFADVVTCFQAFHWFPGHETIEEFARILRPRGRVALVWNEFDEKDAFTAAFAGLQDRFGRNGPQDAVPYDFNAQVRLFAANRFVAQAKQTFPNSQAFATAEDLIGRARGTSFAPRDEASLDAMSAELRSVHALFSEIAPEPALKYNTVVHLFDRRP
jgi:SAM-dependent methyltransferase